MFLMKLVLNLARFGENLRSEQWLSLLDLLRLWRLWEPSAPIIVSACGSEEMDVEKPWGKPTANDVRLQQGNQQEYMIIYE